ncbi:unnamed protein product [Rotaria magnacalcarata]|uniref:Uncharacterized protein n=1 Tax=Rotaria magnacalcarata TaxID=392030 RepID=A0A8S3INB5_9BILA|nr:unnamed protein product [Rotaria magnacalcarata]
MAKSNESFAFKILIIGESSVGKSCLMTRFVDETFQSAFLPTIGVDFKVRTLMIDNYPCKVQIWLVIKSIKQENEFKLYFVVEGIS